MTTTHQICTNNISMHATDKVNLNNNGDKPL